MSPRHSVVPYSISTLKKLLCQYSEASEFVVDNKLHSVYFESYFKKLRAKTIIIENNYIDRDFLRDYAGYYARCFRTYERKCTRFHFFNILFNTKDFDSLIGGGESNITIKKFKKGYLGFIVVKKLPKTIIGRTCLKTYPTKKTERYYPVLRMYAVNLFGIPLSVNTLAFQEQDRVAAACATTALWSVFQATSLLFNHNIPSPIDITKIASAILSYMEPRALPSKGLTFEQICYAVKYVGLEPIRANIQDDFLFRGIIYAYLNLGVPILMQCSLVDVSKAIFDDEGYYDVRKDPEAYLGEHAVAITGYSRSKSMHISLGPNKFKLIGTQIDKIYVHDDQVGPFARVILDDRKVIIGNTNLPELYYSAFTSWVGSNGQIGSVRALPQIAIIPLYETIRIPFDVVLDTMIQFDAFIEMLRAKGYLPYKESLTWEIFLSTINNYKEEIFNSTNFGQEDKRELLISELPRHIWRVIIYDGSNKALELILDATDIEQGSFIRKIIGYDLWLFDILNVVSKENSLISEFQLLRKSHAWKIIDWFARHS